MNKEIKYTDEQIEAIMNEIRAEEYNLHRNGHQTAAVKEMMGDMLTDEEQEYL